MTALKTFAIGVVLVLATQSPTKADAVSSSTSWVYYGGGDGSSNYSLRNQFPNLFSAKSVALTAPIPVPIFPTIAPSANATQASVTAGERTAPAASTITTSAPSSSTTADAYVNLGTSPAPEASQLTTGGGQPWYESPSVMKVYGGSVPNASQQASFTSMVLDDVKQTFNSSGLNPSITTDPGTPANHTLSVVSGTSYPSNSNAIGITDVGHSGFSFIDKLNYASTPNELATAVAKNVSHELMHAFGVGTHPDSSGNYIDTATASWSLLTNPNSTFSPSAISLITQTGYGANGNGVSGAQMIEGEQVIEAVPEPATWAIWSLGGVICLVARTRKLGKSDLR